MNQRIKIAVDDECVDRMVVAALKRTIHNAKQITNPEDVEYYRELKAAARVVLAHYSSSRSK